MRVARLRIFGFRGIKEADIHLTDTSVLIGPNNVGKTTVIEALALILGRDGMVRALTEHDFYGSTPARQDRIKIIATIVGFLHADPARHPEWFSFRKGVPKWFNPASGVESATPQAAPFELACEIGFQARFDHDTLEVETCRYFHDDQSTDDVFVDEAVTTVGINLVRDIGLFLIAANRSWDRMISFGSELFRRVVSTEKGLPAESILAERDRLRQPDNALELDPKLAPIVTEVNQEVASLFGTGSDLRLRITATDSASVLDAVIPHFGSPGAAVPARRQGSGLISLQSLFLLLHFGKRRLETGKGFCLAIEEPELHLPPAIQRRVLRRLERLSSQTIVSTHSPLIAGFSDPTKILVLSNKAGTLTARPLLADPLGATTPNAIRTLFQLRRVELVAALMADAVVVPEGIYDAEWLGLFSRIVELQAGASPAGSSFSSSIGVVPTHDAAIEATVEKIAAAHPNVFALVDGDTEGRKYAQTLAKGGLSLVLRWPDDWTIEDVVGWIIEPAIAAILAALATDISPAPQSGADLVARLKSNDRKDPLHLKGDRVAYDAIARAIGEHVPCVARVAEILDGIAKAVKGGETPRFIKTDSVLIFQP